MSRIYLERLASDAGLILERRHLHPEGEAGYERDKALIRKIEERIQRFAALEIRINEVLKHTKAIIDPPTPVVFWVLSAVPKPGPYFNPAPYLYVDVNYDVMKLLTLEVNRQAIGELAIRLVEEALSKLRGVPGFPLKEVQNECYRFRDDDYCYTEMSGETTIPGSKIKGRIDLEVSGAGTKRIFTASYRGKPLIKQKISEINWPEMAVSSRFHGFALDGDTICVRPNPHHIASKDPTRQLPDGSARIDLNHYPEVLALVRDKGWG